MVVLPILPALPQGMAGSRMAIVVPFFFFFFVPVTPLSFLILRGMREPYGSLSSFVLFLAGLGVLPCFVEVLRIRTGLLKKLNNCSSPQ